MQKSIVRKNLVCLVIILFIGIAVAPSVTSIEFSKSKTSNSNDLVEIDVQFFKRKDVEDHKMYITREQDEQLELLIESFKENLDNAESRKETIEIYKDMVVSLDELGILPEDLSCEEAQQLVTGENRFYKPGKMKLNKYIDLVYDRFKNKNPGLFENTNTFCLIAGSTTSTLPQSPLMTLYKLIGESFDILARLSFFAFLNPFPIGYTIGIGHYCNFGHTTHPGEGWIFTLGALGIRFWNGEMFGDISLPPIIEPITGSEYYPGITGFTGIKISLLFELSLYLGFALLVKIEPET